MFKRKQPHRRPRLPRREPRENCIIYLSESDDSDVESDFEWDAVSDVESDVFDGDEQDEARGLALGSSIVQKPEDLKITDTQVPYAPKKDINDATPISPLGPILERYKVAIDTKQPDYVKKTLYDSIIGYIHFNALTLSDVKNLVPRYTRDWSIALRLGSSIGYHYAGGRIAECDKEAMLVHILMRGDPTHRIYEHAVKQISKCLSKKPKPRELPLSSQTLDRQCERKKNGQGEREACLREFPEALRKPSDFLPGGAGSVAELYVDGFGLQWADARRLGAGQKVDSQMSPEKDSAKANDFQGASEIPTSDDLFARRDDEAIKVKLPSKTATSVLPHGLAPFPPLETKTWRRRDGEGLRPSVELRKQDMLFGNVQYKRVRVKLPPR